MPEQQAIAKFVDRETAKLDTLVARVREAIDRLRELRIALISAAVTGGIDVRKEADERRHFRTRLRGTPLRRPYSGTARVRLLRNGSHYLDMPPGGYRKRQDEDYDRNLCLIPEDVLDFVLVTQPQEWKRLSQHHGAAVEEQFLKRLPPKSGAGALSTCCATEIRDMGCRFRLAYFRPSSGLNEETRWLYRGNIFSVARQLHYSERNNSSLDLALFLNGIPIFTAELKNPLTGQTVQHAIRQYRTGPRPSGASLHLWTVPGTLRRRP